MAYITPNSDIIICQGVPLDSDYNHTLYVTSATAQYNAFYVYKKYQLSNYSYQRSGSNKIRVGILNDNLYGCNYMMFKNTAYGGKWFYAFIETREYINDNTTEITYKIDVMQTYYFDYVVEPSFVEREHSATDNFGDNRQPEPFESTYYIERPAVNMTFPWTTTNAHRWTLTMLVYHPSQSASAIFGPWYSVKDKLYRTYSIWWYPFNDNDPQESLPDFRTGYNSIMGTQDGQCYGTYQLPYDFTNAYFNLSQPSSPMKSFSVQSPTNFYNPTDNTTYTPKNKKMLQSPYNYFSVTNNCGEVKDFKYEDFAVNETNSAIFNIYGVLGPKPSMILEPINYAGGSYENAIKFENFPELAVEQSGFSSWLRNEALASVINLIGAYISVGSLSSSSLTNILPTLTQDTATARAINPATNRLIQVSQSEHITKTQGETIKTEKHLGNSRFISDATNSLGRFAHGLATPVNNGGIIREGAIPVMMNKLGFVAIRHQIPLDIARSIDDYFTMFGYATNKVKVPNIRDGYAAKRPYWNYIKTANCVLHPNYPETQGLDADTESDISEIYNHGITFWTNLSQVGNYTLNNAPQG